MSNNSTVITYLGDGSTTLFNFPFDYLRKSFVKVLLDGVETTFTFRSDYTVLLFPAPAAGVVVIIKRLTDRDRLVNFVDGSILRATDLNVGQLQAIHIAAEAIDASGASMILDDEGSYDAGFRRIAALGDPVNPRDAVNKRWAETAMSSQLALASAERAAAVVARSDAETAAATATTKASAASSSAATAVAATVLTAADVQSSISILADTNAERLAAEAARVGIEDAEAAATAKASEAASSAATAAANAALTAADVQSTISLRADTVAERAAAVVARAGAEAAAATATTKASEASSSATAAAANAALTAADVQSTISILADTSAAKTAAEAARNTAQTYRDQALTYRSDANSYKNSALSASTAAANSATDAANTAAGFTVDIKAWAHFDNTGSVRKHKNVSSVVRNGVGDYTINFTTKIPGSTYDHIGVFGSCKVSYNPGAGRGTVSVADVAYASAYLGDTSGCTGVRVQAYNSAGNAVDAVSVMVQVLG